MELTPAQIERLRYIEANPSCFINALFIATSKVCKRTGRRKAFGTHNWSVPETLEKLGLIHRDVKLIPHKNPAYFGRPREPRYSLNLTCQGAYGPRNPLICLHLPCNQATMVARQKEVVMRCNMNFDMYADVRDALREGLGRGASYYHNYKWTRVLRYINLRKSDLHKIYEILDNEAMRDFVTFSIKAGTNPRRYDTVCIKIPKRE